LFIPSFLRIAPEGEELLAAMREKIEELHREVIEEK
jgi:hypothetical protein